MNSLKENLLRKIIRNEIKSILNENVQPLMEMPSFYQVTDPEGFKEKYDEVKATGKFKEGSVMRKILDKLATDGEVDYHKLKVELGKTDTASFNNPNTRKYLDGIDLPSNEEKFDFSSFLKAGGKTPGKPAGTASKKTKGSEEAVNLIMSNPNISMDQKVELLKALGYAAPGKTSSTEEEAGEIKEFLQFKKWKNRLK